MKKIFSILSLPLLAGMLLFSGGGCSKDIGSSATVTGTFVVTTSTSTPIDTTSSTRSTTTIPSLIDQPVSEWPRYEFKELGFSIQLPFESGVVEYAFNYCSFCIDTSTYEYVGKLSVDTKTNYTFMGSYSENYQYDRDGDLTDIRDLELGKSPKLIFFGSENFKYPIQPLKRLYHENNEIIIFDATNYYKNTDMNLEKNRWAFTFRLPTSKKFRAVLLTFDNKNIPLERATQLIQTIKFQKN